MLFICSRLRYCEAHQAKFLCKPRPVSHHYRLPRPLVRRLYLRFVPNWCKLCSLVNVVCRWVHTLLWQKFQIRLARQLPKFGVTVGFPIPRERSSIAHIERITPQFKVVPVEFHNEEPRGLVKVCGVPKQTVFYVRVVGWPFALPTHGYVEIIRLHEIWKVFREPFKVQQVSDLSLFGKAVVKELPLGYKVTLLGKQTVETFWIQKGRSVFHFAGATEQLLKILSRATVHTLFVQTFLP